MQLTSDCSCFFSDILFRHRRVASALCLRWRSASKRLHRGALKQEIHRTMGDRGEYRLARQSQSLENLVIEISEVRASWTLTRGLPARTSISRRNSSFLSKHIVSMHWAHALKVHNRQPYRTGTTRHPISTVRHGTGDNVDALPSCCSPP